MRALKAVGVLFFGLVTIMIVSAFSGCGSSSSSTSSTPSAQSYVGTQTQGDFWTWAVNGSSFTAADLNTTYIYNGTATALTAANSTGFTELDVTSSSDPGLQANIIAGNATAYEVQAPGSVMMVAPAPFETITESGGAWFGTRQPPIVAIAQGSCPTSGGIFNWMKVPPKGWCSGDDPYGTCPGGTQPGEAFGIANLTVSGGLYSLSSTSYFLNGTQDGPSNNAIMANATCSNGVITGTDNSGDTIHISFTPSGIFFVDMPPGQGSIVGAQALSADVNFNNLMANGNTYKGFAFSSERQFNSYTGPWTMPVMGVANGAALVGQNYTDLQSGALDSNQGTISPSSAGSSQPSPGLIKAVMNDGTQKNHDAAIVVTQINGKYVFLMIRDNWNWSGGCNTTSSCNGTGEMSGQNAFVIQQ